MTIIDTPIGALRAYERNAKKHSDKQIGQVALSIERYGWQQPIVADKNGVIVIGHCRYKAAKKLGLETVPVTYADDLTDEQIRELRIIDNKLNESEWDMEALETELESISEDLDEFKFDFPKNEQDTGVEDDGFEETNQAEQAEAKAKRGDVYQLGRHRIMCGDSTDPHDLDRLLSGATPDTWFVDPPYEQEQLYEVIPVNNDGRLFVFSDHKHWQKAVSTATARGWVGRFEFVWDNVQSWYTPNRPLARHKTCFVFGGDPTWNYDAAIIKDGKTREEKDVRNTRGVDHYVPLAGAVHMRTVEAFPNTAQNDENGYGKPVQWLGAMINGYAGDVVLDLFGGSGAVLIACEQTRRTCYAMELDPRYVDIIIERWEKFTGGKAELIE